MSLDVADRLVWRLARECRNEDVLIVGVATPIATAAGLVARELLVPNLTILVAASVQPATHDIGRTMLEADFAARHSAGSFGQADVLDLIQRGAVTLQFVSPAQVDRRGRLNASEVIRVDSRRMRLPGPLALPDVSCLVGRLVAYRAAHTPRFLVEHVDFVTGLGSADVAQRQSAGLTGQGVVAVVTELGVLRFDSHTDSVVLVSCAPGVSVDDVVAKTGFPLDTQTATAEDPPPTEARELLRRVIDPHGVRGLEIPATRAAALDRLEALTA